MNAQVLTLPCRVSVDELRFDRVTMKEAVRRIARMARLHDRARFVCSGNLDHLVLADRDPEFRAAYKKADLVVADGAPVVWLSKLAARSTIATLPERVAGCDLFWEIARMSAEANLRVFFLGGEPGAAVNVARMVEQRYPGARIAGTYCPPPETFDAPEEQARMKRLIRRAAPDILLVAFGAPKQEKWIAANKDALGIPVSIGVGRSFEVATGMRNGPPRWVRAARLLPYLVRAAVRALTRRFAASLRA